MARTYDPAHSRRAGVARSFSVGATTFDFHERQVLVTGGTRGLGRAVALAFARAGAEVTITGTESLASAYDRGLRHLRYARLDLTDPDSIDRIAGEQSSLDILVHAAGARVPRTSDAQEREFVDHSVRLGLVGPEQLTHRLRRQLAQSPMRGGAAVINTHQFGRWLALAHGPQQAHTELVAATTRMARRFGSDGIRVNCVASAVPIPRPASAQAAAGDGATVLTRVHTQRTGTTQDLATSVLFLGSQASAFVTGQTLVVNATPTGGARRA
ncbi:SDR family NAD(P)-dependent oxidoreductase [Nocardioides sp. Bht2]|uniref:SDR family NAD(P)-dependent oxidoreductase n=1 Tax=Nocardioides sp. Bht2 TaxID=3392297 RepID=UPI0039B4D357